MTKPKLFDEAIHFRAREGTKARIDALRGAARQGDFIRELLEEALAVREEAAKHHDAGAEPKHKADTKRALKGGASVHAVVAPREAAIGVDAGVDQEGNHRVATIRAAITSANGKPGNRR